MPPGMSEALGMDKALALALSGGEDYELLVALDRTSFDEAAAKLKQLGTSFTKVGVFHDEETKLGITDMDGEPMTGSAFDHFQ
jgi:thiamine-monophosphate kinase